MLFRLKKKTSTVPKTVVEWNDTPATFPVEEIFRKSCIKRKRYLIMPLAMLGISIVVLAKMVDETMSHISELNPHYHPFSGMSYCAISLALYLLSLVFMISSITKEIKRTITQRDRVQQFVNKNGTNSIPQLLDLLLLRIKGGYSSSLPDTIVYNLARLFSEVDTSSKMELSSKQNDLLISLLDPEGEYSKDFNTKQKRQLMHFSVMLAPTLLNVVGIWGGERAVNALLLKFKSTSSYNVKRSIQAKLNELSSDYQMLISETEAGIDDELVTTTNRKFKSLKRNFFSSFRSNFRFFLFILPFIIPVMILLFPVTLNSSPVDFLSFMAMAMSGCLALFLFFTFLPFYFDMHQKSLGLRNAVKDLPESICNFLSIELNFNSFYTQALIIRNLLENTDPSQLEPLNRSQLNKIHLLLSSPNLYKTQLKEFQRLPLPDIGVIQAILRGLVFLGNSSSMKVIEKFCNTTDNKEYKIVALECLDALKARLTEKPEQLLRASSFTSDALLRASQSISTNEQLLKPMVAEEPIVFPQPIETNPLEVKNQL